MADYVVDHMNPLACGGGDDPGNMQWQTTAEAKAKDAWERKGILEISGSRALLCDLTARAGRVLSEDDPVAGALIVFA